jgi:iron complex transport system ATP-binding protein
MTASPAPDLDTAPAPTALALDGITYAVGDPARTILHPIDWHVGAGQHWAVIGANGAGKTTLLKVATGALAPTTGSVTLLGERHGAPGFKDPRLRTAIIGGVPPQFAPQMTPAEVVLLRSSGPFALFGARVTDAERARATELLTRFGCAHLRDRRYADCSQGERQRILLARVLMRSPQLLLYDEPTSGLDLPSREGLLQAMAHLAADRPGVATVTVTHHLEELPSSTTHALLLREGRIVAQGDVEQTLTGATLSECFGVEVEVTRLGDRWAARARRSAW